MYFSKQVNTSIEDLIKKLVKFSTDELNCIKREHDFDWTKRPLTKQHKYFAFRETACLDYLQEMLVLKQYEKLKNLMHSVHKDSVSDKNLNNFNNNIVSFFFI